MLISMLFNSQPSVTGEMERREPCLVIRRVEQSGILFAQQLSQVW